MSRLCDYTDCDRVHSGRGLCRYHYNRLPDVMDKALTESKLFTAQHPDKRAEYRRRTIEARRAYLRGWRARKPEHVSAANSIRRQRGDAALTFQDKANSVAWRALIQDRPCTYCGSRADVMHYDHIKPLARGGTDAWHNIVRACATCNLRKNTKSLTEFLTSQPS